MSNTGFFRKRTLFSPTSIAGCQVWLDAADTATMGFSGTSVNTWTSKGTPSLTATYSGTAPTYTTYNTYPALAFNGSSTKMTTGTIASYGAAGTTWIAAAINLTAVTSTTPVDASAILASAGPPERSIRFSINTANTCYAIHTGYLRGDINNNTNGVRGFIDTPSSFNSYTNGSTFYTNNTSVTWQTATNTSFILGQWNTGYLNGYIFECVAYDGILTLSQYQQVEGYLATKWGFRNLLPQGHPGVTSVLYPLSRQPQMLPRLYYIQFSPASIAGCQLWYDGNDPAGTGVKPSTGATVTTWKDKSGNANDGTSGTATFQVDSVGSYINFTGGQTYTITNPNIVVNTYFTIFVVEQLQNYSGGESAFMGGSGSTNANLHVRYRNGGDGIKFGFFSNDLDVLITAFYTNATQPVRIWSFSFIANSRTIYLNGTSIGSDANNTQLSGWVGAAIGAMVSYGGQYYNGKMREVMIYSGTIVTTQRQQIESYLAQKWGLTSQLPANHPNNTTPAGTPALTAQVYGRVKRNTTPYIIYIISGLLFHLDAGNPASYSGSGSTWYDLAGSGLTTTLYNSPTYSSANGGYLNFVPASSQYGKTSAALATLTTWTVELWHYFNATNSSGNPCLLTDIYNSSGGSPMNFVIGTVNGISQDLGSLYYSGSTWYGTANYSLPSVGWYHIVGTFDGSNLKLYINNVLTRTSASTTTPVSGGIGIHIMRRWDSVGYTDFWGGYLSIVRIYNRALQASEISTNYAGSKGRFGLS